MTYAADRLYSEVAYVAYHFNWPQADILELTHAERLRYIDEIAAINTRINEGSTNGGP